MTQIDIISGFLGAGKTTLIQKLLQRLPSGKTVIIENEFGEVGIDGALLQRDGYQMYEITTGCICCLMQNDFLSTLETILKDHAPERVLIEPTGISILSDIVALLKREPFAATCTVHALITVVDCENFLEQRDVFGEFFADQISNATHLLLSKAQNVPQETVAAVVKAVRQMNPGAPLLAQSWDTVSLDALDECLNGEVRLDYARQMAEPDKRSCREKKFSTFAAKLASPVTLPWLTERLEQMKTGACGGALRGKGFVQCAEGPYAFSFTNHSYDIHKFDGDVSGRVCFIGLGFNRAALGALWDTGGASA